MVKRLKTLTKTRFKKTDFNSFFFFLVFAVVIWFFVQFSKKYNEIIDIPISYVNIPHDKFIAEDNPELLQLMMEENGFKIGWFSLFPPTLNIDVSEAIEQEGKLVYYFDENRNAILSQLNIDFEDSHFIKDQLEIQYQQKQEKTLPVISSIRVEFAPGYSAEDSLQLKPDSIRVSGPDNLLDTLTKLYTNPVLLVKVKEDISGTIGIDTAGLTDISLFHPQIAYSLEVEKFTEGRVQLPIELINVPEGLNVVIFPRTALLFYQVALKNYNEVNASDFRVVADFSKVKEKQSFLIPEIVKRPSFTSNLRLNENKIQFIIKK